MYPPVMKEIVPKVTEFALYHASRHPELIIANVEVVDVANTSDNIGNGNGNEAIYRIRASIGNIGGFSTRVMKAGGSLDSNYPISVKLVIPKGADILSRIKVFEIGALGALGDSENVEWFVKMPLILQGQKQKITIQASHPRAGTYTEDCNI